jgi:hypothetical protein
LQQEGSFHPTNDPVTRRRRTVDRSSSDPKTFHTTNSPVYHASFKLTPTPITTTLNPRNTLRHVYFQTLFAFAEMSSEPSSIIIALLCHLGQTRQRGNQTALSRFTARPAIDAFTYYNVRITPEESFPPPLILPIGTTHPSRDQPRRNRFNVRHIQLGDPINLACGIPFDNQSQLFQAGCLTYRAHPLQSHLFNLSLT